MRRLRRERPLRRPAPPEPLGDACPQCGHATDPHVFVALTFDTVRGVPDVPTGGAVVCPVDGCLCIARWSLGVGGEGGPS